MRSEPDQVVSEGPPPSFLRQPGEMARRILGHPWEQTALGAPGEWPQPLQTLTGVILAADQPMFLIWGTEAIWLFPQRRLHSALSAANTPTRWDDTLSMRSGQRRARRSGRCSRRCSPAARSRWTIGARPRPQRNGRGGRTSPSPTRRCGTRRGSSRASSASARRPPNSSAAAADRSCGEGPSGRRRRRPGGRGTDRAGVARGRHRRHLGLGRVGRQLHRRRAVRQVVRHRPRAVSGRPPPGAGHGVDPSRRPRPGGRRGRRRPRPGRTLSLRVPGAARRRRYRWTEASGRYIELDDCGAALRFPGVLVDVEERRRTEEALLQSNTLLRTFMEAVPGVIYAKDGDGRLLVGNQGTARLLGRPYEDFVARHRSRTARRQGRGRHRHGQRPADHDDGRRRTA